ncbi:WD40 repeat domain-containing protein [Streptomyces sp. MBT62]|uniref:WD40 repeat domain-containing protein n=1 Tax=Streptomyces sp. MBT62 TaxID=2800410 RepID=UPI00190B2AB2|nr:WD40 repeat domain-containing protein [Streptomyces sp. MBT62]MBK3568982.1 WD40 repeat domain-containing protein [Streptomyces sp. MBT62]
MPGLMAAHLPATAPAVATALPEPEAEPAASVSVPAPCAPLPAVIRSRQELSSSRSPLPIETSGTTYDMAQSLAWLDSRHFAVGRWDGSMSIFEFTVSRSTGPVLCRNVNSPAYQGVRTVAPLPGASLVTSNDDGSIALWSSASGLWSDLRLTETPRFDRALGVATSALAVRSGGTVGSLVTGHASGHLSVWSYAPQRPRLTFLRSVDLRNPAPVNPWGLHDINAIDAVTDSRTVARVVTGSEDGYLCVVEIPSGRVLSQTVFNPRARRGVNDLGVRGNSLLVATCSVGREDHNLWYYKIGGAKWDIVLRDRANLVVDPSRAQVFNFSTVWGEYRKGPCWFASTEEGALWMGTADSGLTAIGHQAVTAPLGSALGWTSGPRRLAMVAYDLYEFTM